MSYHSEYYQKHRKHLDKVYRSYYHKPFGKLCVMYTSALQRVLGQDKDRAHKYEGLPICSREQFYRKFLYSEHYLELFKKWKSSGYCLKLSPSLDRIDNSKGYTIDNIQIITQSENRKKEAYSNSIH